MRSVFHGVSGCFWPAEGDDLQDVSLSERPWDLLTVSTVHARDAAAEASSNKDIQVQSLFLYLSTVIYFSHML